jgi:hypothetical protein
MNAPFRSQDFTAETTKPESTSRLLRDLLRALLTILSSPKGDQGGWEGGARGL